MNVVCKTVSLFVYGVASLAQCSAAVQMWADNEGRGEKIVAPGAALLSPNITGGSHTG